MLIMKFSLNRIIKSFKIGLLTAIVFCAVITPNTAFSQDQEPEQGTSTRPDPVNSSSGSNSSTSGSTSPWGNSSGLSVGTPTIGSSTIGDGTSINATNADPAADPRLGPRGGSIRRPASINGRTPGGNPDVPFDDNMNLAFLVSGLIFAYLVAKKKMFAKAVVVKK